MSHSKKDQLAFEIFVVLEAQKILFLLFEKKTVNLSCQVCNKMLKNFANFPFYF